MHLLSGSGSPTSVAANELRALHRQGGEEQLYARDARGDHSLLVTYVDGTDSWNFIPPLFYPEVGLALSGNAQVEAVFKSPL